VEVKSWQAIGRKIKSARQSQGLSQTELAERSRINISSVFRVEKGKAIRLTTVARIADGLDITLDTILSSVDLPPERQNMVVHRAARAPWFADEDRRAKVPADHVEAYQDAAERSRIGRLGFVSWFMCPPTAIMKNGPGIVPLEIHGLYYRAFNSQFYEDAVIFVIRGKVSVQAGSESVDLTEGDWVGFKSADLVSIGPAEGAEIQTSLPLVLWIGANRRNVRKTRHLFRPANH